MERSPTAPARPGTDGDQSSVASDDPSIQPLNDAMRALQKRLEKGRGVTLEALPAKERRAARVLLTSGEINASRTDYGLTALHRSVFS